MDWREFLTCSLAGLVGGGLASGPAGRGRAWGRTSLPPTFSVIPVVGDGRWIWNEPPAGQTGYLEPRSFSVEIGIECEGLGAKGLVPGW